MQTFRTLVFAATLAGVAAAGEIPINFQRVILPAGVSPIRIASGPDGNIWFINAQSSSKPREQLVGKVTASGEVTTYALTTTQPQITLGAIAAGPDGNVWVTYRQSSLSGTGGDAGVARVTTSGAVTLFAVPGNTNPGDAIAAGPDGNLWFLDASNTQAFRVTPQGAGNRFSIPSTGRFSKSITAGPDGNVWFPMGNDIIRMTPSGTATAFPAAAGGFGITSGPDGNLWFTGSVASNKIGRITPSGQITDFPIPTADSEPRGIAAGPDGNIWFVEKRARKVAQLIVSTASAIGTILHASETVVINEKAAPGFLDPNDLVFPSAATAHADPGLWLREGDESSGSELFKSDFDLGFDLVVDKKASRVAGPGDTIRITYVITVTNMGQGHAGGFQLVDVLPLQFTPLGTPEGTKTNKACEYEDFARSVKCPISDLSPGETREIYLTGTVPVNSGAVRNEATATLARDANPANNTSVFQFDSGEPFINVSKIFFHEPQGWWITFENDGGRATTGVVTMRDRIPSGVDIGEITADPQGVKCEVVQGVLECTVPAGLPVGAPVRIAIPIKAKRDGRIENQAFVSGGGAPDAQSQIAVIDRPAVSALAPQTTTSVDGRP